MVDIMYLLSVEYKSIFADKVKRIRFGKSYFNK